MDSGVETGNDSNDSLVTQHDNLVTMTSVNNSTQNQTSAINTSENASGTSENLPKKSAIDSIPVAEATSQESLPGASESNENIPSNSLVSVNTFNSGPLFSLALVPANEKAKIFEFQIPPMYNNDCPLPAPIDFLKSKLCNHGKIKPFKYYTPKVKRHQFLVCKDFKGILNERKMRLAAATNNIEMMQRLLNLGLSPNNCDEQGRSPLHLASCRGYSEMVSLLLTYGADPNQRDCLGNTPLHLAAVTSKISVVTLLLMAGTDVLSSDYRGHNPLQLAQTKLRVLQNCEGTDMNQIKDEVRNVIVMLLAYLQKQKDAREQVEALSTFCSRLTLSNTSDQIQDDVRNLLANIDSLSLTN